MVYSSVGTRSRAGMTASNLPRSMMTSLRSNRRTVPVTIAPMRSLNSSKTIVRSMPRSVCAIDCLKTCAAMRPSSFVLTSTSTESPSAASALSRRAFCRLISS